MTGIIKAPQASGSGATTLDGLTDVVITTPTTNQVISFNGTNWVNNTVAGGGSLDLATIHSYNLALS
jgi:hypothetical protein